MRNQILCFTVIAASLAIGCDEANPERPPRDRTTPTQPTPTPPKEELQPEPVPIDRLKYDARNALKVISQLLERKEEERAFRYLVDVLELTYLRASLATYTPFEEIERDAQLVLDGIKDSLFVENDKLAFELILKCLELQHSRGRENWYARRLSRRSP